MVAVGRLKGLKKLPAIPYLLQDMGPKGQVRPLILLAHFLVAFLLFTAHAHLFNTAVSHRICTAYHDVQSGGGGDIANAQDDVQQPITPQTTPYPRVGLVRKPGDLGWGPCRLKRQAGGGGGGQRDSAGACVRCSM